ncbi:MAG: phage minor head protein [Desulfovibrionaceae bacterium]
MAGLDFSKRPPKEALAWFRAKGLKPGFDHRDVWREEHATSFTVAKAMELDILGDIRAEVDRALADGRTFRDFAKDLTPTLQKKGWWGRKDMIDPLTGETRSVQLGSPRRLRTIYETNMRTARAAGQWERIQRAKEALPYLLYSLGPSREHRPEHVGWHGVLLPVDDPWWTTHYPPNGWGCKCRVRQVSAAEARRLGTHGVPAPEPEQEIDPDTGLPTGHLKASAVKVQTTAPPTNHRQWVNKRTGEVHHVPAGIDPGWEYNVGQAGRLGQAARQYMGKVAAAEVGLGAQAAASCLKRPGRLWPWTSAPGLRLSATGVWSAAAVGAS